MGQLNWFGVAARLCRYGCEPMSARRASLRHCAALSIGCVVERDAEDKDPRLNGDTDIASHLSCRLASEPL